MEPLTDPTYPQEELEDLPDERPHRRAARPHPYAGIDRGGNDAGTTASRQNYHFRTMCEIRKNAVRVFQTLYDLRPQLAHELGDAEMRRVLRLAGDYVTCGVCGVLIDRVDTDAFVAGCGHCFHKAPTNCWERSGNRCKLCR